MKFLVTYPNGSREVLASEATTPGAYAMMHMGSTLEAYVALGGRIEPEPEQAPEQEMPPSDSGLLHTGDVPPEGISAVAHSTSI